MNFDTDAIADYCQRFLGYGNFDTPIWTVGLEEGVPTGNSALAELSARLELWTDDRRPELWDLPGLHRGLEARGIPQPHFFSQSRPKHQRTWSAFIRTLLVARGATPPIGLDAVRDFQVNQLGKAGGPALIELLPLANHKIKEWDYAELGDRPGLEFLERRGKYEKALRGARARLIRDKITEFRPRAVLLYGNNAKSRPVWEDVMGQPLLPLPGLLDVLGAVVGETRVALAPHPAHGVRSDTYERIGLWLRDGRGGPTEFPLAA